MKNSSQEHNMAGDSPQSAAKPKRKRWKRVVGWSLAGVVTMVVAALAALIIWLGPIAEWFIEKYDNEYVGRRLEMDNLSIKLFKGHASADNVILYEADGTTHFARIGHFDIDMDLGEVLNNHIHITRARLVDPYLCIDQNVEVFNIDDLVEFIYATYLTEEEVEEESEPWVITLDNVTIENGHFLYYDREIEQRWELTALDAKCPRFYLDNHFSHIEASTIVNDVCDLAGVIELNYDNWDFTFDGVGHNFPMSETFKYWVPYLNVGSVTGDVDADFQLDGNVMDIFNMHISGEAWSRGLAITASNGSNILTTNEMYVDVEDVVIEQDRYILNTLTANGFASELVFNADGTMSIDALFYEEPEVSIETTVSSVGEDMYDVKERVTVNTATEESALDNMVIRIGHADLKGGEFSYSDKTLHRPFEYKLRDISLKGDNLDMEGHNEVTMRAKMPMQGSVNLRWEGSLNDFHNQSLMLMLTNIDMIGLSPYVEYFTGFPITSGNLTFRSQNIVADGELSGINQIGTYQFAVGKRDKTMDVEYKLPLRLGVYVLTDKDDHIDIDLPIKGRLDSPEFSYNKIIMKALGGLFVKIVASPFEWMAGNKQDAFRHFDLDILAPGLDSEHYARLDKMAEELKADESIKVRLTQQVNYKRATQRLANLSLKIAYYNSTVEDKRAYLDMLAFQRINDMKISNRAVMEYADSQLVARGIDPKMMSSSAKAMALYGDMVDERLLQLMNHRNRMIMEYMSFQHQDLPAGAFAISEVDIDKVKEYAGKDRFGVTLLIDDQEVAVNSDSEEETQSEAEGADPSSLDYAEEETEASGTDVVAEQ